MGVYTDECRRLLELIGGKENIGAVSHCVTRMRFVLNDPKRADIRKIEELPSVKGTFTQAGQFQVIIGNTVSAFYNDFTDVAGIDGVSKESVKSAAKNNQNIIQRLMADLAEIFAPLIPAIIVGGLILGFRNVIGDIKMFDNGTRTLVETSQFWAGTYSFLWLIGEAIFHFLPVGIVWSITKKMGTTQMLGIVLGLTLISPQLLNAYSVASTAPADIPVWDFGFAKVEMIGYQAQVLPAILAGFTLVYLEKGLRKICPSVISMIVVPFFALIISVILAHTVLGPIGWKIGSVISNVVNAGLASAANWLFAAVFGFFYAPLVITGLHHMSNAIDLQLISDFGGTNLWPMIALSNIAQGSAVLAMIFLQRGDIKAREISIPACISCYLGVTEPAIFGVNLKYAFPFICAMAGSACAAAVSVGMGVRASAIGVGGLPGILSIIPQYIPIFALCIAIAVAVPFVLTYFVGRRKLSMAASDNTSHRADNEYIGNKTDNSKCEIKAFLSGKVINIEDVPDKVFSEKILGDGVAIEPSDNILTAPADGEIINVMEGSFHACGMRLKNGVELLFHVGLDTVSMNGDGFECFVKEGDKVKAGDNLILFDPEKIIAAGHPTVTMMVVSDEGNTSNIEFFTGGIAVARETVIAVCERLENEK